MKYVKVTKDLTVDIRMCKSMYVPILKFNKIKILAHILYMIFWAILL